MKDSVTTAVLICSVLLFVIVIQLVELNDTYTEIKEQQQLKHTHCALHH